MKDEIGTHLIALSAPSGKELNSRLKELSTFLKDCNASDTPLIDVCSSINTSPQTIKHLHRAVVVGKTYDELISKVDAEELIQDVATENPPKLCFLYSAYGVLYPKMSYGIYETSALFRHYVDLVEKEVIKCYDQNNTLEEYKSFQDVVYAENHLLESKSLSLNVNMRLEIILHKLWEYWGIVPDVVLGCSCGEYAAAYAAGFLPFEDAIMQFTHATFLLEGDETVANGGMFVIMLGKEAVERLIVDFNKLVPPNSNVWIDLAVINCEIQTIVTMSEEAIPLFDQFCTSRKIRASRLTSSNTFHSRGVRSITRCNEALGKVPSNPKRSDCDYISSLTGNLINEIDNATYWGAIVRGQVNFHKACHSAYNCGARTFLEIGAHPVQAAIMVMNADEVGSEPITCLPSLQQKQDDWTTLMTTFATLYTQGYPTNWNALYDKYSKNKINTPFHEIELSKQLNGTTENLSAEDGINLLNRKSVSAFITKEVQKILKKSGRTVSLDTISKQNFEELGLSSLQIVLMKNMLQNMLGENLILKFSDVIDCMNVNELSERICSKIENVQHKM